MPRLALHLLVALLLVSAGCAELGSDPAVREQRAVEAIENAREHAESVDAYRFNLSISVTADDGRASYDATVVGRVNVTDQAMAATTRAEGRELAGYVDGARVYQQCPPRGLHWGQQNASAETWIQHTPLGRQLAMLETGDLYWNGTTTVGGMELVHVTGHPSLDEFGDRSGPGTSLPSDRDAVEEVTLEAWLEPESGRVHRSILTVDVSSGDQRATATATTTFRRYGSTVYVRVPTDARDAFFDGGCPE